MWFQLFIEKAIGKKYGGYDENMKNGLEDWEFWLNFIEDKKFFLLYLRNINELSDFLFFKIQANK